jgi:hypothetical protein
VGDGGLGGETDLVVMVVDEPDKVVGGGSRASGMGCEGPEGGRLVGGERGKKRGEQGGGVDEGEMEKLEEGVRETVGVR